jgi:hypothetical protein
LTRKANRQNAELDRSRVLTYVSGDDAAIWIVGISAGSGSSTSAQEKSEQANENEPKNKGPANENELKPTPSM